MISLVIFWERVCDRWRALRKRIEVSWYRRWYRRQTPKIGEQMTAIDAAGFGGHDVPAHPRKFRSEGW